MTDILMLDLEGVLVYLGAPHLGERYPRPFAQTFVNVCKELFDEVWLNTCVDKENSLLAVKEEFGISSFKYYPWKKSIPERTKIMIDEGYANWHETKSPIYLGKSVGYENFVESRMIHVEDGISIEEKRNMKELGVFYLPIKSYGLFLSDKEISDDDKLLGVLEEMLKLLKCK